MPDERRAIRGRGTAVNPPNRYERLAYVEDLEPSDEQDEERLPRTELLRDSSRTIIARNDSPDVGFEASINPYRGCEHGCAYCYARPSHEQLGFSSGLDFETKILVKENAPELLRHELASPRWKPQPIALSGVTDPYQPIERRLQITRRCVEVLADFRNPVAVVTKNYLVTRDVDYLAELARYDAALVFVSVTTLDAALQGKLEPRASTPARRLAAIEALARAGVPVGVMVAPIIPAVNDHEIPAILTAAARAGATAAGHVMLRLPYAVKELFERWLEAHLPDRKDKVLSRVRELRGGQLNDPQFGSRMRGTGPYASSVNALFAAACRRVGLNQRRRLLSTAAFRRPEGSQLSLFR
ncbi:MAG: PA0069 family radical SAM protein [Luteitalea sp.]|nr:PA0069 family radical SAM protein [Luteitalea sp.]